jgi:lactoylglutathione lyase
MNVKKVGNVILAVRDLNKSLEFYNKISGMPIKNQRENWVDLGQSGALLSLHPADESSPHTGTSVDNGILIGLLVGDVASAVDELKLKNVRIKKEIRE